MKMIKTPKRYALIHRNTGSIRRSLETRQLARDAKRTTERIYDTQRQAYIR